jgi:proline iminopeptidase
MLTADRFTLSETLVDVGGGHRLYVQDWGVPDAPHPVLVLHGGPGVPSTDSHKEFFDPSRQRVLFCDQRGVGRSEPYGSLEDNTTQHLIDDMVAILDRFEIEKAVLMGGSWGSCLALVLAVAHPERVRALALYGLLTGRQDEIDWLNEARWRTFFPEVWQWYLDRTPPEHHGDPTGFHFARILGEDDEASKESAYAYTTADSAVMELDDRFKPPPFEDDFDAAPARLQAHYMTHSHFLPEDHVLDNADRLTMPVYVIQGRYDMICPPVHAYRLVERLPRGELIWAVSGHGPNRESWNLLRSSLLELTQERGLTTAT